MIPCTFTKDMIIVETKYIWGVYVKYFTKKGLKNSKT